MLRFITISICLSLIGLPVTTVGTTIATSPMPNARGMELNEVPAGLVAAIAKTNARKVARDPAYRIDRRGCAQLSAPQFSACFDPDGARFHTAHTALRLRLRAWGRPGRLGALALESSRPHGNRIDYRGTGIQAWWRVLPLGYEQGFTINKAPAGRGPVVIELSANIAPVKRGNSLAWATLHYGKLLVTDAAGRVLPSTLTVSGQRVFLRFDADHAHYPLTVDPLVWVEQEVTASDGAANDEFGFSVAVSGNTALVGALGHLVSGHAHQGAAYVYTETNGTWSQVAELTSNDGAAGDDFGYSVSLSNSSTTALVGAPDHQVSGHADQGAAYVYTETNGAWSQMAELTASDGASPDLFGSSVSLSGTGTTALIGAPERIVGGNLEQGTAYVYTETNASWSQTAELTASDGASFDVFGTSAALSGTTALVGAPGHTVGGNTSQGVAYVYTETNGTWNQAAELTSNDGAAGDQFGSAVSLSSSGSTALMGAAQHTVGGNLDQGAAYLYTETNGTWNQADELTASDGIADDKFGSSVALSGSATAALVGAPYRPVGVNPTAQGVAYVYTETNGVWSQTAEITSRNTFDADLFGSSVALSGAGTTGLTGARQQGVGLNNLQGAAYLLESADLSLVLSSPATVASGADYTSKAIITNNGATESLPLSVLLQVPSGTNYVSSSATQGSCSESQPGFYIIVTCNLGNLAPNGGSASGSLTLQASAAAGTTLANSASLALSSSSLMQISTTTVTAVPSVTGLANASVTIGQSVPAESFTISGTGTLTVTASSSDTTLLANAGLSVSSGCNANGAKCTLSMMPAAGQTGTATVTVTVTDTNGQQGSDSFTLTVLDVAATANNGNVTTDEGTAVSGTLSATAAYNGQMFTYQLVSQPVHGAATITNVTTGAFTYTPISGFSGSDSFTFNVKDAAGTLSNTATVAITVNSVSSPPPPPPSPPSPSGSGGGALGMLSLGLLLGLLLIDQKYRLRQDV